jgi:hypothetical protein
MISTRDDYKKIYVHSLIPKAILKHSLFNKLKCNFKWTEKGYGYLGKKKFHLYLPWDYGLATLDQKIKYSKITLLEKFLNKNSKLIYEYNIEYYQIPMFLDDILSRMINKIPLIIKYKYIGNIYLVEKNFLKCEDFKFHPNLWKE